MPKQNVPYPAEPDPGYRRRRQSDKQRLDDEAVFAKRRPRPRSLPSLEAFDAVDGLPDGDRWSTWDQPSASERGPKPYPAWLVTELAATDTELGLLKTGKEADVFLLRRAVPGTDRACLLAVKRYRSSEHRMFHRDATYLEGRHARESRAARAMASRSSAGREMIAQGWASAEFTALCRLHGAGVPVPYPVQILDTEIMLEFVGEADGTAAPRLSETRPSASELADLWEQLVRALRVMAGHGLAHGDLSAYNLLVHHGRLIMIDLPQVVEVAGNPRGTEFLDRDAENVARWFTARGLTAGDLAAGAGAAAAVRAGAGAGGTVDAGTVAPADLAAVLRDDAGLTAPRLDLLPGDAALREMQKARRLSPSAGRSNGRSGRGSSRRR